MVGAGIVGLAVARELPARQPERTVTVLEREARGLPTRPATTRASCTPASTTRRARSRRACASQGARELYATARARHPPRNAGKLIVALSADEVGRPGRARAARPRQRRPRTPPRAPQEIADIEPHVTGVDALHSPATAVVDFRAVAEAFADDVARGGRRGRHLLRGRGRRRQRQPHPRPPRPRGVPRALRRLLRRRLVGPARGRRRREPRPADRPVPRRLPAAAARARATSCARWSTRCPTPHCRSSASTSPAASTTRS